MKTHPTQLDVRGNTASSRQHAPRLTGVITPAENWPHSETPTLSVTTHQELSGTDAGQQLRATLDNPAAERQKAPSDDYPLTVKDAAKFLGVSPQTVYLWVERKQIPHLRVMGRNIRFLRSDLEPFRASFKQEMENE